MIMSWKAGQNVRAFIIIYSNTTWSCYVILTYAYIDRFRSHVSIDCNHTQVVCWQISFWFVWWCRFYPLDMYLLQSRLLVPLQGLPVHIGIALQESSNGVALSSFWRCLCYLVCTDSCRGQGGNWKYNSACLRILSWIGFWAVFYSLYQACLFGLNPINIIELIELFKTIEAKVN